MINKEIQKNRRIRTKKEHKANVNWKREHKLIAWEDNQTLSMYKATQRLFTVYRG